VSFTLEGPGVLIGDNPFSLIGGTGAVWVRAKEEAGVVRLTAKHPRLGTQVVEIGVAKASEIAGWDGQQVLFA
jgi:beta-galactosidase